MPGSSPSCHPWLTTQLQLLTKQHDPASSDTGSFQEAGEGGRTLDIHVGNEGVPQNQLSTNSKVTASACTARSASAAEIGVNVTDDALQDVVRCWAKLPIMIREAVHAIVLRATTTSETPNSSG